MHSKVWTSRNSVRVQVMNAVTKIGDAYGLKNNLNSKILDRFKIWLVTASVTLDHSITFWGICCGRFLCKLED